LKLSDFNARIKTGAFSATYTLKIPHLDRLYTLIGSKLYGSLVASGKISKDKTLKIGGTTRSLGGDVRYMLAGNRLDTKVSNVPLPNILKLYGLVPGFLGRASGEATYNLTSRAGKADFTITSFQIKPSTLTNTLKMVIGRDPARIIFETTNLHAKIKKEIIAYTLYAKGGYSNLELTNGQFNAKTKAIRAKLKFIYGKHTFYGKIKGTADHPKVIVDTKALIKDKLKKKLNKKLQEKLKGVFGKQAETLLHGLGL